MPPAPADRDATRALYDAAADDYEAAFADELQHLPVDMEVLDSVAFRGTVLDIGCGPGQVGAYLAARAARVIGCDLSTGMLRVASRRAPSRGFFASDACFLAVGTGRAGGAVAFYSLHHLPRAHLPVALAEVRRALVSGGRFIACTHLGEGDVHIREFFGRSADADAALYSRAAFVGAIEDAGFAVDQVRERGPAVGEAPTDRIYVTATARPAGRIVS